jgi:hypothetical protein
MFTNNAFRGRLLGNTKFGGTKICTGTITIQPLIHSPWQMNVSLYNYVYLGKVANGWDICYLIFYNKLPPIIFLCN